MSPRRGRQQAIKAQTEQQKELTAQRQEGQKEQETLKQAFNANGELDRGWMREILDTEDLEEILQPWTIEKIQAMLNKQWVLSNLTDAETHDRVYKLGVMKIKILGEHPPEESQIKREFRAFLYDDPTENLGELTPQERNTVDQIIMTLQTMVARSRDGFERKQINTRIGRTESESSGSESSDGAFSGIWS
jgi:hypothetical protein